MDNLWMSLMGISDEESLDVQLDKAAKFMTTQFNASFNLEDSGCAWKIAYLDDGDKIKFSKMSGEVEVGFMVLNLYNNQVEFSDSSDLDLKTLALALMLAGI